MGLKGGGAGYGTQTVEFANGTVDAFGRLRVSEVQSLINIVQHGQDWSLLVDEETIGTGNIAYDKPNGRRVLTTSAASDVAICQTFIRAQYQAGKGHTIQMTMGNFAPETNVVKRIGYFQATTTTPFDSTKDGLFLESSDGKISINVYKAGTIVEQTYQEDWNIDSFGLGSINRSGLTIDWDNTQILSVDFQYLGVGRVRWNLNIGGQIIPFHESEHANLLTTTYMQSPDQPLRWEIRQTGAGSGTFNFICGSVGTEGVINLLGLPRGINSDNTVITAAATNTRYAALGMRLQSGSLNGTISIQNINILSDSTNKTGLWELVLNPTVAGVFTYNALSGSTIEYAVGATANTVTGGIVMQTGTFSSVVSSVLAISNLIRLGVAIDGTRDALVLVVKPRGTNTDVLPAINFEEYA